MKLKHFTGLLLLLLLIPSLNMQVAVGENKEELIPRTNATTKLGIASRHDSAIIDLFLSQFVKSDYAADVGITSVDEISVYTPTTFESFSRAMTSSVFEVDIGWGGGPTLFNNLAAEGSILPITNTSVLSTINAALPDVIAGAEMKSYDDNDDMIWAANAISSFGFTVNHNELESRGLPMPTTWEDLASPEFFTSVSQPNIGLGNAPDTTSNTRIYQIILQKFGWERGWQVIYDMAANGKVYGGSVETRASVISGETAVAMTIDFYGLIAMSENPATEYIVPANGSIVNGDPISYSKNPPHMDAANAFIEFVFSPEGQGYWLDTKINRMPIREDAFDTAYAQKRDDIDLLHDLYLTTLSNEGIVFDEDLALSLEETMRYHFEATITNVHTKLKSTWGDIMNTYKGGGFSDNRLDQINDIFGQPAITQEEAISFEHNITSDAAFRVTKQGEWAETVSSNFDRAEEMITEPETIVSSGVTSLSSASSIAPTTTDIPFNAFSVFAGVIASVMAIQLIRRKNKR